MITNLRTELPNQMNKLQAYIFGELIVPLDVHVEYFPHKALYIEDRNSTHSQM